MVTGIGTGSFARVYEGKWNHSLFATKELTSVHTLMASLEAKRNSSECDKDTKNDDGI